VVTQDKTRCENHELMHCIALALQIGTTMDASG
jgi:hypothetical protein